MRMDELETYLNQLLNIAHFHDYCPNGLQVEGRSEVYQLVSGVTASFDFLQAAVAAGADACWCIMVISGAVRTMRLLAGSTAVLRC